jgi:uncharacterized iron-regulated membrane protein
MMQVRALTGRKIWPEICSKPPMANEQQSLNHEPVPSRALVPVETRRSSAPASDSRPLATFITQMLACEARAASFRHYRRAEPSDATALYGDAQETKPSSRFERVL